MEFLNITSVNLSRRSVLVMHIYLLVCLFVCLLMVV